MTPAASIVAPMNNNRRSRKRRHSSAVGSTAATSSARRILSGGMRPPSIHWRISLRKLAICPPLTPFKLPGLLLALARRNGGEVADREQPDTDPDEAHDPLHRAGIREIEQEQLHHDDRQERRAHDPVLAQAGAGCMQHE